MLGADSSAAFGGVGHLLLRQAQDAFRTVRCCLSYGYVLRTVRFHRLALARLREGRLSLSKPACHGCGRVRANNGDHEGGAGAPHPSTSSGCLSYGAMLPFVRCHVLRTVRFHRLALARLREGRLTLSKPRVSRLRRVRANNGDHEGGAGAPHPSTSSGCLRQAQDAFDKLRMPSTGSGCLRQAQDAFRTVPCCLSCGAMFID